MYNFRARSTLWHEDVLGLLGVNALAFTVIGEELYLLTLSEANGDLSLFRLPEAGDRSRAPQLVDRIDGSAASGTLGGAWLGLMASHVLGPQILPAGRLDDELLRYTINASGFSASNVMNSDRDFSGITIGETVKLGWREILYYSRQDAGGIEAVKLLSDGRIKARPGVSDSEAHALLDISDLHYANIDGAHVLLAISAFDAGVSSFRIGRHGNLHDRDYVTPFDDSGFARPQKIITAEVDGKTFAVMAASGTSSLTVYRVNNHGKMTETDHLIDTASTRFAQASQLVSVTLDWGTFILAAGSDDGISVLELERHGNLRPVSILADDFDIGLKNISDIKVIERGGAHVLAVSSASEHAVSFFDLDFKDYDQRISGTKDPDSLTGGAGRDYIDGGGLGDRIDGGAGDDLLIDGAGRDYLRGGSGADIFRFVDDERRDVILDFERGVDKIDLSEISDLGARADLLLRGRVFGAVLLHPTDEDFYIRIESHDGKRIEAWEWGDADFIF